MTLSTVIQENIEKVRCVGWPSRRLWVELRCEERLGRVVDTLVRAVVRVGKQRLPTYISAHREKGTHPEADKWEQASDVL